MLIINNYWGIAVGLASGAAICDGIKLGLTINDASKKVLIMLPSQPMNWLKNIIVCTSIHFNL